MSKDTMSSDFHKVDDLKFDISKLQNALKTVLQRKSYDDAAGTKYIAGISLNQIPGDSESISSCKFAAMILHWAATFFALALNASALGDSACVIIIGFPESEPDIIP